MSDASLRSQPSPGPIEPAGHETPEPDEFDPVTDWDRFDDVVSDVYEHYYENGRRYQSFKHGRYPVPNDDMEQDREDMKHAMVMELTDGKLFYAPIGANPRRILDIGTGTGRRPPRPPPELHSCGRGSVC